MTGSQPATAGQSHPDDREPLTVNPAEHIYTIFRKCLEVSDLGRGDVDCCPDSITAIDLGVMRETFESLDMDEPTILALIPAVLAEVDRRRVEHVRIAAISVALPYIETRTVQFLRQRGTISDIDATTLAADVALKVFECLCGRWPRGNVGAWIAKIRDSVTASYYRKYTPLAQSRLQRRVALDSCSDERRNMELLLQGMSAPIRDIFERRRSGQQWDEIQKELNLTTEELRHILQEIELPSGGRSRPRRKSSVKRSL